jgi:hypothetical protein
MSDDINPIVGWRAPGGDPYSIDSADYAVEEAAEENTVVEAIYADEALSNRLRCEATDIYLHPRLNCAEALAINAERREVYALTEDMEDDESWGEFNPTKRYAMVSQYSDVNRHRISAVSSFSDEPDWSTLSYDWEGWIPVELWDLDTGLTAKMVAVSNRHPWKKA